MSNRSKADNLFDHLVGERKQLRWHFQTECPQWNVEHEALLIDLGITLAVWEIDVYDRPGLVEALDKAAELAPIEQVETL